MLTDLDDIRRSIERALPPDVAATLRDDGIALALTPSSDLGPIVTISDQLAEMEQLEHMVTYKKNVTGVDNTIFISPGVRVQHGPRVKVAINPPDSINPLSEQASVSISTGEVVAGEVSPALLKQVRKFIELNRDVLLEYWDARITTDVLQARLQAVPAEKE
jgi:Domain of unknown function (DUF4160)